MAKSPVLNIEGKVRKSTVKFAQALLDAGVKAHTVCKGVAGDYMYIKGKGRFNLSIILDYRVDCALVLVQTRRGHLQASALCETHNEFRTLLKVWNIAAY